MKETVPVTYLLFGRLPMWHSDGALQLPSKLEIKPTGPPRGSKALKAERDLFVARRKPYEKGGGRRDNGAEAKQANGEAAPQKKGPLAEAIPRNSF